MSDVDRSINLVAIAHNMNVKKTHNMLKVDMMLFFSFFSLVLGATSWQIIYGSHNGQTLASGVLRAEMLHSFVQDELRRRLKEPDATCSAVESRAFELDKSHVDVCVCAKCNGLMVETLCARCHERNVNATFVYEVLDLAGQISYVEHLKSCVDLWFVSNRVAAGLFVEHGAKATAVVHHHHTNLQNVVSACRQSAPVRVVASTASPANLPAEFERDLQTILARDNIQFKSIASKYFLGGAPSESNGWNQLEFHQGLDDVDVAVIWPPFFDVDHLTLRPITRLAHWWSHGIPVIFHRAIDTYREVAGDDLACDDISCVVERIRFLSEHPDVRCRFADEALVRSRRFNVTSSSSDYVGAILDFLKKS
jgi:hypothetical protein